MKNKFFLRPLIFILLLAVFAVNFSFSQASDSKSFEKDKENLIKVCATISSNKITKGDFKQNKLIKRIKREMVSTGTFIVSADDGILWQTEKPYYSSMAMTKSAIVQTNAKGKKSVLSSNSNATFEQFAKVLSSVFTGNAEILIENFEVEFIGSVDNWNINLVPKNSSVRNFIEEIEMAGRISIDTMTIHESSGDFIRYDFSNQSYPDKLSDEEKEFFKL